MQSVKIFGGNGNLKLAEAIAHAFGRNLGTVSVRKFSDGEIWVSFDESVRGCDVFLVQSTGAPSDNLVELILMIDAAKRASADYVTVVVPYFGYARQDRKDQPRVSIAAKLMANVLSAAGADRLMTVDLHADQIQGFFDIPVDHLDGSSIFVPYLSNLNFEHLVFASPDVGGVKRARNYAKYFGVDLVVVDKHREKANQIASMQLIGNVEDADVVLVDDLIDTGGTMCKAAQLILDKGAKSVRAVVTHPVLSGNAYDNINNSVLEELVVTDTLQLKNKSDKIRVLSIADLFAKAIRKIHDHESTSSLFLKGFN